MKTGVSSVAFGVQSLAESVNSFILSEDGAPVGAASMLTKRVGGLIADAHALRKHQLDLSPRDMLKHAWQTSLSHMPLYC